MNLIKKKREKMKNNLLSIESNEIKFVATTKILSIKKLGLFTVNASTSVSKVNFLFFVN